MSAPSCWKDGNTAAKWKSRRFKLANGLSNKHFCKKVQKALLEQLLDEGRSVKVCQTKRLEWVQIALSYDHTELHTQHKQYIQVQCDPVVSVETQWTNKQKSWVIKSHREKIRKLGQNSAMPPWPSKSICTILNASGWAINPVNAVE